MGNRGYKQLPITYREEKCIGRLIEYLKEEDTNLSEEVRNLLWITKGAEYLSAICAPPEEIKKHRLESIKYYAALLEEARMLLQIENSTTAGTESNTNIVPLKSSQTIAKINQSKEDKAFKDSPIVRKNSIAESLSL